MQNPTPLCLVHAAFVSELWSRWNTVPDNVILDKFSVPSSIPNPAAVSIDDGHITDRDDLKVYIITLCSVLRIFGKYMSITGDDA